MSGDSRRLHLLLEGQTEEQVARDLLQPHLETCGWQVSYSVIKTKRTASSGAHRGGVTNWPKLEREIRLLLRGRSFDVVTTVIDFYAFPADAPGMATKPPKDAVEYVERALAEAIADRRFVPHLTLHEIEAWVFAAAAELGTLYGDDELTSALRRCAAEAGGPELVNDGPETAPSKRLAKLWPGYVKTIDGPLALAELGLSALRTQCPHFDAWLKRLEGL